MIKRLKGYYGTFKFVSLGKNSIPSEKKIIDNACIGFPGTDNMIIFNMPGIPALQTKIIDLNDIHSNTTLLFPRIKKMNEEFFILSGYYMDEQKNWLVVGKISGKIPEDVTTFKDEFEYPLNYWAE